MLVRRIARPLLASTFIFGGVDALRNPQSKAPAAEKLDILHKPGVDKLNLANTEQAVKVNAAVQVAAGSLLALGRFPRIASLADRECVEVPTSHFSESDRDRGHAPRIAECRCWITGHKPLEKGRVTPAARTRDCATSISLRGGSPGECRAEHRACRRGPAPSRIGGFVELVF